MRGPRKAAERAIALGDDDPFDYALALELGWSHAAIGELSYDEYVRWRAFMTWRASERDFIRRVAIERARR
jgi:hypothetical protein